MAIIDVPPILGFSEVSSFKLRRATNLLRSRYTAQAQKVSYPYAIWMLSATLREYDELSANRIRSFLVKLEGTKNEFRLPVPGYKRPIAGNWPNTVVHISVAARATDIVFKGSPPGFGPYMTEGDYFTIGDELKMVSRDSGPSNTDPARIFFNPPMRKSYGDGQPIILQNPTILMQAADDDIADWALKPPIRQNSAFEAIEAIGI